VGSRTTAQMRILIEMLPFVECPIDAPFGKMREIIK
jgi:hypothetical protein